MTIDWNSVQSWQVSQIVGGLIPGSEWIFPIIETLHVLALTVVFGTIAMVDLRLIGVVSLDTAASKLAAELLPWTWIAWCTAAVMGVLLFLSRANTYAHNLQFQLKFVCMGLAAVNMLIFHFGVYQRVREWDAIRPPPAAKLAGALSITLWVGVIFFGRWIGFTT